MLFYKKIRAKFVYKKFKNRIAMRFLRVLVGAGGFEPPKSKTTDLQSAPFGHSGTLPYLVVGFLRREMYYSIVQFHCQA